MQEYVLGLALSSDRQKVLLIEKKRPVAQAGTWNGVGGKIELGESPNQAMAREFEEETGLVWPPHSWGSLGAIEQSDVFKVWVFFAHGDLQSAKSCTDEVVRVFSNHQLAHFPLTPPLKEIFAALEEKGHWVSKGLSA